MSDIHEPDDESAEVINFELGQVWQVAWTEGNEAFSTTTRFRRSRTSILCGIDHHNGEPVNLHFAVPMIQGRRGNYANQVSTSELLRLYQDGNAQLLGKMELLPP
jgi:hypothetical protein